MTTKPIRLANGQYAGSRAGRPTAHRQPPAQPKKRTAKRPSRRKPGQGWTLKRAALIGVCVAVAVPAVSSLLAGSASGAVGYLCLAGAGAGALWLVGNRRRSSRRGSRLSRRRRSWWG